MHHSSLNLQMLGTHSNVLLLTAFSVVFASAYRTLHAAVGGERLANGCYSTTIHKPEHLPEDLKKQSNLLQSSGDNLHYSIALAKAGPFC